MPFVNCFLQDKVSTNFLYYHFKNRSAMASLPDTLKFTNALLALQAEKATTKSSKVIKFVKFLRKSKANDGRELALSIEAQRQMVGNYLRARYRKYEVAATCMCGHHFTSVITARMVVCGSFG